MAAAHGTLYAFLTLHLRRPATAASPIGVLWTLGVLAEIVVFLYLPQLFRRFALSTHPRRELRLRGRALPRARLGWPHALAVLVGAQLLHAATFGAFHAASVAAVHRVFPTRRRRAARRCSPASPTARAARPARCRGLGWELGGPGLALLARLRWSA